MPNFFHSLKFGIGNTETHLTGLDTPGAPVGLAGQFRAVVCDTVINGLPKCNGAVAHFFYGAKFNVTSHLSPPVE
jgi:hypothetical protein